MASIFDSSKTTTTTLPTWYNDAQKTSATAAKTALDAGKASTDTANAQLATTFGVADNPYTKSLTGMTDIISGNASAFSPDGTPNTASPLGALFAAQNAQFNQVLPGVTAAEGATGIGSGAFGSLRGQTATNTARAGALSSLNAAQMKAMLDAQSQSIQAGNVAGDLGQQYAKTAGDLTDWQQMGGLDVAKKYADIMGSMATTLPKTETAVESKGDYENFLNAISAAGGVIEKGGKAWDDITKQLPWLKDIYTNITSSGTGGFSDTFSGDSLGNMG
jgi:hypothetical protein